MINLRVTVVVEYPAIAEHYPGCDGDPVKMAAYDQQSYEDGLLDLVDLGDVVSTIFEPVSSKSTPCGGRDGHLPCSKPSGHSGPHYFYSA